MKVKTPVDLARKEKLDKHLGLAGVIIATVWVLMFSFLFMLFCNHNFGCFNRKKSQTTPGNNDRVQIYNEGQNSVSQGEH